MTMTFQEVLAHLDALQMHKIKLGLEAMRSFLDQVGRPEEKLKFVHVAGTNGKGSVCAALAEVLDLSGYRIGVFTSPHLSSVRERFRIGCKYISEPTFARLGTRICQVLGDEQITYFEFTTALGLLWFAEADVDLVILETGMGGRLDATNVVTPLVSVITSISMDHEAYLGNNLTQIAGEKAGIIKAGVPVVSGASHPEAAAVIQRVAGERSAPLYTLRQEFDYVVNLDRTWSWRGGKSLGDRTISGLVPSRPSLVQPENDSLVIAVLQLLPKFGFATTEDNLRKGLTDTKWPGRMEYFEQEKSGIGTGSESKASGGAIIRYLLDGAHNPDGVKNLADSLSENFNYRKLICLWGAMVDKDLPTTLGAIAPLVDIFILTRPEGERAAPPELLLSCLSDEQKKKARCLANVEEALNNAKDAATSEDLIVIGGSLYLLGAIRHLLLGDLAC